MKPKLLILASGSGTTFAALAEAEQKLILDMQIVGLIVDRECDAISIARDVEVPVHLVNYADDKATFTARLQDKIKSMNPDFIMLAGFLRKVPNSTVAQFHERIFNTHPSLLPEFGGPGMYGLNVHKAVVEAQKKISGISFHFITENYDEGAVIAQKEVSVAPNETAEQLEVKIKKIEKYFVIEQLNSVAARWRRAGGS